MASFRGNGSGHALPSRKRLRLLMFLVTAAVLTGLVVAAYAADLLKDSELDTVDARFSIRGETKPPDDLVVVAVDDVTFGDLKERWPFPRSLHARVVDNLRRDGARVIAYDVQFTEPTEPAEDEALVGAVERAGNVVLATTEVDERGETGIFGGGGILQEIGARPGSTNFLTDAGAVVRRMPYEVERLKNFAVAAVERARRRSIGRDDFGGGSAWIDYHGGPGTFETVSFSRVVRNQFARGSFRDKIVVVGASAPSLLDVHPTSTSGEEAMAGPEIHANAISTILRDFPLDEAPGVLNVVLIVLMGFLPPLVGLRFGPLFAALAGVAALILFPLAVQAAFGNGLIVAFLYPMAAAALGTVGALGMGLVVDAFERERVRDLFSRFVPEAVVDDVLARVDDDLRLGGTRRTVTVVFSDIRGFTTFSETRSAEEVIEVLNRYLTVMSNVILDHGGTLVSYMGDGIMAVFGAPIDQVDHADRAVAAAREMTGPALESFNEWARENGVADGFRIGVGIMSGDVMAGNVGSERRLEYTTIGDTVNTASRLEGMTKGTPHMIYVAESTRAMLTREAGDLIEVDELPVRGRKAPVKVWSVDGAGPAA